jgi:uncharacterized protein GlcG (DUF336 family)
VPARGRLAAARALLLLAAAALGCSGSSSSGSPPCAPNCLSAANFLSAIDVQRVIAQAVGEAQARGVAATIAVVDRVGNVLAVFQMTGARANFDISSGRGVAGGLDGLINTLPSTQAAIAKAITGAYLSSWGNAFSSRTAGQIVQENFNPGEAQAPSGPLYGVQFSQLSCSDVNTNATQGSVGPKRSPLGLSADPGGLPLYKNAVVVGGIGVIADGVYGLDLDIFDVDQDADELIAVAGSAGFAPPDEIRGERITANGHSFRFVDSESIVSNPANAPAFGTLPGALVAVPGYVTAAVGTGVAFGTPVSGYRPAATGALGALGAFTLVDAGNVERFPPTAGAGAGALAAAEVSRILEEGIKVAQRARAQIRRPLGSAAEVSVVVVDLNGDILGLARTADAPIFGTDVASQKARSALLFSLPNAAALIAALPDAQYLSPPATASSIANYVPAFAGFVGPGGALDGSTAWSTRALGNLHRPMYPDGIGGTPAGPLSKAFAAWSPFNVGFQLDLVYNQLVKGTAGDLSTGCAGRAAGADAAPGPLPQARNGIQIFPGGLPIYRSGALIGAIGVSGDGVDQDDMVAFLALSNAGLGNAPAAMRADRLSPQGTALRYAQCPQSPFNGSAEQNVCAGL